MALERRVKELLDQGDALFTKKRPFDNLMQELALHFYPERADFTVKRNNGDEFGDHLFTSFPVIARRELGNLMSISLRPRATKWLSIHVDDEGVDEGDEERKFLEFLTDIQWRAMYDKQTQFVRSTKQTDHDFVAFGNGVLWYGLNFDGNGLLFRNYHIRDNAWAENGIGVIDTNHRNWEPTARNLVQLFPETVSPQVKKLASKEPDKKVNCRHMVVPQRAFDFKTQRGRRPPFISITVERDTQTLLEQVGLNYFPYIIPRWHTVSGSPFGCSMATSVLLPDGRTMQAVVRTIREAGEKYVDPPMVAVGDAIRGDYNLFAGGITQADIDYDERLGEVLRPISQDRGGMPIGFEIANSLREDIRAGFFLDKMELPTPTSAEMTAFEVRRRIEEHIRAASPIFEPIEEEYSSPLAEGVFNLLRDNGAFPLEQMPESLAGQDIRFTFRSPLADMADQQETETYLDVMNRIIIPAAQVDPSQIANVNITEATRDAMRAAGWRAKWFNPPEAVEQERQRIQQIQEAQQQLQEAGAVADIAETGSGAAAALAKAGE